MAEQKKGKLSDTFGVKEKRSDEIRETLKTAWDSTDKVPDVIKKLLKGCTAKEKERALLFCMLGRRIETNEGQIKIKAVMSYVADAIREAQK